MISRASSCFFSASMSMACQIGLRAVVEPERVVDRRLEVDDTAGDDEELAVARVADTVHHLDRLAFRRDCGARETGRESEDEKPDGVCHCRDSSQNPLSRG